MWLHKLTRHNDASVTALVATSATALLIVSGATLPRAARAQSPDASDWGFYGGDAFGQHYSSLDQIKRDNVDSLTVAWTYRTGELGDGLARSSKLTFEATPVLAFGLLYLETATNIVIALDPETGATVTAQKTFSAKITITGKGYRASGTAGDTVVSGVICDLDKSFKLQTNNPFLEGFEFTPSSPSFGNWEISTKNGVVGGGGGQYVLEGPADNRTGITLKGFSSGYGQGSGRRTPTLSGGGTMHLTLTPLSLNPTTKDACSE